MSRFASTVRWGAFALAVAIQLVVLYSPESGGTPPFPHADKVVHVGVFAIVAVTGVLARLRPVPLGAVLVAHAVISEVVQAVVLPGRSGSPWDAVADVLGAALGLLLAASWTRGPHRQPARRDTTAQ